MIYHAEYTHFVVEVFCPPLWDQVLFELPGELGQSMGKAPRLGLITARLLLRKFHLKRNDVWLGRAGA